MTLRERLEADLKTAMVAKDRERLSCLRMIKSKMQEKEVALRAERGKDYRLEEAELLQVITAYAKQRRDSIAGYESGGRTELAEREKAELAMVAEYLPQQLDEARIRELVRAAIEETGASSARDMGKVMKALIPKTKGVADGKRVSEIVRESLAS